MTKIDDSQVWVLGTQIDGVGKSISWIPKTIPSFADCEILIVDTTSINEKIILSMDINIVKILFEEIKKRFDAGLLIICILSKSIVGNIEDQGGSYYPVGNYFWSPVDCNVKEIPKGKALRTTFSERFLFENYVKNILEWGLALDSPSEKTMYFDEDGTSMRNIGLILSNSNDILGGMFKKFSGFGGDFVMLPPLETSEKSLQKILQILGIGVKTQAPSWTDKIKIPGISQLELQVNELQTEINKKQLEINDLSEKMYEKNNLKQLVYATDKELESITRNALEILRLKKVREGEPGKDDILFDFSNKTRYTLCSVEVKGIEGNIKLKDLRQLGQWVDDHLDKGIKAKGLMISNTFRLDDLDKSKKQRSELDTDNLAYAVKQEFCILPTHVLLDLCKWVLEGNQPNLNKIENAIANTNGFLRLDDLK